MGDDVVDIVVLVYLGDVVYGGFYVGVVFSMCCVLFLCVVDFV